MKVGMISLGCPKNLVDSEVMLGLTEQAGHTITPDASEAEVARDLNMALGTVKSLNSRGLAKLRVTVGPRPADEETPIEIEVRR